MMIHLNIVFQNSFLIIQMLMYIVVKKITFSSNIFFVLQIVFDTQGKYTKRLSAFRTFSLHKIRKFNCLPSMFSNNSFFEKFFRKFPTLINHVLKSVMHIDQPNKLIINLIEDREWIEYRIRLAQSTPRKIKSCVSTRSKSSRTKNI
jgi:hypothetical protein